MQRFLMEPSGGSMFYQGYGRRPSLIGIKFSDHELSIADKGIQALNFGKHVRFYSTQNGLP